MPNFRTCVLLLPLACGFAWAQSEAPAPQNDEPHNKAAQPPGDSVGVVPIKTQKAAYPPEAAQNGIQGQVWLKLQISETGDVEGVDVVSGDPILAKAAVAAAKQWKFKPFIRNGKATKISTRIPFDFAFSGNVSDKPPTAQPIDIAKLVTLPQGVTAGLLLHKVQPVYPETARRNRIQGVVLLKAIIGRDGRISELTPISGPKELIPTAIGAVEQWRYKPYVANGEPVEVQTEITVNFQLK